MNVYTGGILTRLRLASLFAVALALAGGYAAPSRVVESTRFLTAIVRTDDGGRVEIEERSERRVIPAVAGG